MNKFSYIELAILQMLQNGELHGYAMSAIMRDCSDGNLLLPAGSLYPALHKLEKNGFISSSISKASGRKRRVYTLTPLGAEVLADEIRSWQVIVRTMNVLLGAA